MTKIKGFVYKGCVNVYRKNNDFVTDGRIFRDLQAAKDNRDETMEYIATKKISWAY